MENKTRAGKGKQNAVVTGCPPVLYESPKHLRADDASDERSMVHLATLDELVAQEQIVRQAW